MNQHVGGIEGDTEGPGICEKVNMQWSYPETVLFRVFLKQVLHL